MPHFYPFFSGGMRSRASDRHGSGQFGASRGRRRHQGLDIAAPPGATVLAPMAGIVVREARPYPGDARYRGIVIEGTGDWAGYEVKIFYAEGLISGQVVPGQAVATVQDLTLKYPGITNHIHVEFRNRGTLLDPFEAYGACF